MEGLTRDEQIARSWAWLAYVRHRVAVSNMTDGTWPEPLGRTLNGEQRDPKAILKYHRRHIGEIVKLYPDFPARADRRGVPGHDPHNPKGVDRCKD